jgi:hypothetical protein
MRSISTFPENIPVNTVRFVGDQTTDSYQMAAFWENQGRIRLEQTVVQSMLSIATLPPCAATHLIGMPLEYASGGIRFRFGVSYESKSSD